MVLGTGNRFEGATKPTSVEAEAYDSSLYAIRYTEIPTNMQLRISYTAGGLEEYIGYAPKGLAEEDASWLLHHLEYDGSDRLIKRTIAYDTWTNRAAASYS